MGAAGSVSKSLENRSHFEEVEKESRNEMNKVKLSLDLKDTTLLSPRDHTISPITPSSTFSTSMPSLLSPKRNTPKNLQSFEFPFSAFTVKLEKWNSSQVNLLPTEFFYHIGKETVDFLDTASGLPILQFPVQNILRWGFNSHERIFQFDIFDWKSLHTGKKTNGIKILLSTPEGPMIERCMSEAVNRLMDDINTIALSKEDFEKLLNALFDVEYNLSPSWREIFTSFTGLSRLTAKQGKQAPFEKLEFACLMYDRMMYKESFQVIISAFDDPAERENIVHVLSSKFGSAVSSMFVSTCCLGHATEPLQLESDDDI